MPETSLRHAKPTEHRVHERFGVYSPKHRMNTAGSMQWEHTPCCFLMDPGAFISCGFRVGRDVHALFCSDMVVMRGNSFCMRRGLGMPIIRLRIRLFRQTWPASSQI
eukprot:6212650-Pleurochrysis_carterae.AAC.5